MIEPGMSIEQRRKVLEADCIRFLAPEAPLSLSTPAMIQWMETASRMLVKPHLEAGQQTVGTRIDVAHLAPAIAGSLVIYRSRVAAVEGRRIVFEVEAAEDDEVIGRGVHERHVIDIERFAARLRRRLG